MDYWGKLCIEVKSTDKIAFISEVLCIGCGICVKKWVILAYPFWASTGKFLLVIFWRSIQMSVRSDSDYQPANKFGDCSYPQIYRQCFQASSIANSTSGSGTRSCWNKRYRKIYGPEDSCRKTQAQPGKIWRSSRLARDSQIFQRFGATKLFHKGAGGQLESAHQASICWPYTANDQRHHDSQPNAW